MKLASLKSGRDGQLVVVSRDLSRAVAVTDIAAPSRFRLQGNGSPNSSPFRPP